MVRRHVRFLAPAAVFVVFLAACSGGGVTVAGEALDDPAAALSKADDAWLAGLQSAIDGEVATVSSESRCYFYRQKSDTSDVRSSVYCGPVRRLGVPAEDSWDVLPFDVVVGKDGATHAKVPKSPSRTASPVNESKLFRPDGAEPVKVSALAEPKAPRTTMADVAVMVPAESISLTASFKDLAEPYRLTTPSTSLAVTAHARLPLVPAELIGMSGQATGGEGAPAYRPAPGQVVQAWRVTLGPGPVKPEPNLQDEGWMSSDDDSRDASTTFAIAAGGQRLVVHGSPAGADESAYGDENDDGVFTVDCESLPCDADETHQYVLLVSSSAGSQRMVATVDGADQELDLSSGKLTGEVSAVEYGRSRLAQQVSTTWPTRSVSVSFGEWDEKSFNYGGRVDAVYLTAFDVNDGWAPKGKAWLEVPIQSDPAPDDSADFTLALDSWTLATGGKTLAANDSAGADWTFAFLVPDDFTKGTFTYLPQGTVQGQDDDWEEVTKAFRADRARTLKISIPLGPSA